MQVGRISKCRLLFRIVSNHVFASSSVHVCVPVCVFSSYDVTHFMSLCVKA